MYGPKLKAKDGNIFVSGSRMKKEMCGEKREKGIHAVFEGQFSEVSS